MTKTEITKGVVSFVVGSCTAKVVRDIILNNVSPAEKLTDKVAISIACYVIGAIVADRTKVWTDAQIDKLIEQWKKLNAKENPETATV